MDRVPLDSVAQYMELKWKLDPCTIPTVSSWRDESGSASSSNRSSSLPETPEGYHSPSPSDEEETPTTPDMKDIEFISRTVWITKLPETVSLAQIMQFVRAAGGIISIDIYQERNSQAGNVIASDEISLQDVETTQSSFGPRCAKVEFRYSRDADAFVQHHVNTLALLDGSSNKHMPKLSLLRQPLNSTFKAFLSRGNNYLVQHNYTRTLQVTGVPAECVWFTINVCSLSGIIDAEYDDMMAILLVEFRGLHDAYMAYCILAEEGVPSFNPSTEEYGQEDLPVEFVTDFATASLDDLDDIADPYPHIPRNHIESRFKMTPYDDVWPEVYTPVMRYAALNPRARTEIVNRARAEAKQLLDTNLAQLSTYYKLSPQSWSWEHEGHPQFWQDLSQNWYQEALDVFFETPRPDLFNMASCQRYSRIAAHRRERCFAEGLPSWAIPSCEECEYGCRQARKPVGSPKFVLDYISQTRGQDDDESCG